MTKHYDAVPPYIQADPDKYLTDGETMTSLGGRVYSKDIEQLERDWFEVLEDDDEISDEEFGMLVKEVL